MMGNGTAIRLNEGDPPEESPLLGRWVDLRTVQLNDVGGATVSWIQAFPYKTFEHPLHGKLEFTMERAKRFAENVKNKVRGQDLDIDYDHKALTTEAAGWVKDAEPRSDGLYILVEWTKAAAQKIREGAFRYFSPEFRDSWKHPESGVQYSDVLFGGGLTNRPFMKDMVPINLTEVIGYETGQGGRLNEGGNQVTREQLEALAKNLKVEFTAETSDDDLYSAVAEASVQESEADPNGGVDPSGTGEPAPTPELAQLSELAKTNPAVAVALAELEANRGRIQALETANHLQGVNVALSEIKGDKFTLAPKYLDKLRAAGIKLGENGVEVLGIVRDIFKDGIVELGERGGGDPDNRKLDEAATEFEAEVKKLTEGDDKLSYIDAVERVALENEELYERYRAAAYAGKEQ